MISVEEKVDALMRNFEQIENGLCEKIETVVDQRLDKVLAIDIFHSQYQILRNNVRNCESKIESLAKKLTKIIKNTKGNLKYSLEDLNKRIDSLLTLEGVVDVLNLDVVRFSECVSNINKIEEIITKVKKL